MCSSFATACAVVTALSLPRRGQAAGHQRRADTSATRSRHSAGSRQRLAQRTARRRVEPRNRNEMKGPSPPGGGPFFVLDRGALGWRQLCEIGHASPVLEVAIRRRRAASEQLVHRGAAFGPIFSRKSSRTRRGACRPPRAGGGLPHRSAGSACRACALGHEERSTRPSRSRPSTSRVTPEAVEHDCLRQLDVAHSVIGSARQLDEHVIVAQREPVSSHQLRSSSRVIALWVARKRTQVRTSDSSVQWLELIDSLRTQQERLAR